MQHIVLAIRPMRGHILFLFRTDAKVGSWFPFGEPGKGGMIGMHRDVQYLVSSTVVIQSWRHPFV